MAFSSSLRLESSVPQSIGRFSHIEELELVAVGDSLPLEIGHLRNLKLLRIVESPTLLDSNEFCKFELTKLERLELQCCFQEHRIFSLPRYIWNLNNLRSLFIYAVEDAIPSLPDATGGLVNLESLEIYNPKLSSISSNIGKLKHLKRLRLCPKLQHLPSEIGNLHRLEVADFEKCSNLRATDFLFEASALQSSLKVIRITHNQQLRHSSSAPFQQTAHLAKLCQFLAKCKELEVVDLKGNEISNLDGFEALTTSRLGTTSRLRIINFSENPIIYHSLSEDDKDRLMQLLRVHPGLGSFGGDGKTIDKVVDAIILRSWAFPHADHWQQINRVGRSLIMNPDHSSIALSIWPTVFARANHVFSKYRAKKRTANAIFYLLRNNPELLVSLGKTKR
jgi:Leucine-rich repeat (LRR) protein